METSKILSADLLDLLFEGRNKNYGAYELRKHYRQRVNLALAGTAFVCLLFVAGSLLAGSRKKGSIELPAVTVELSEFKEKEKKVEPIPPVKQEEKVQSIKDVTPRIVPDNDVTPEDEVPPVEEIEHAVIGTVTQEGKEIDVIAPPVEKAIGPGTAPLKKDEDYEAEFKTVQYVAEFPGGTAAWIKFLERYLNSNIPVDNGAPEGKYTVVVSFIVNKNGEISDVKAENDPGYGTAAEAIRVISKGPKWKPALQNGRNVIYRQKQGISFVVSGQ